MLRSVLGLALALLATPAFAQTPEGRINLAIAGKTLRDRGGLSLDQKVVLKRAILSDHAGQVYDLRYDAAREPRGLHWDTRGACETGAPLPSVVIIPFSAPSATPPYTVRLELETPDPSEESGCRDIVITFDGFR